METITEKKDKKTTLRELRRKKLIELSKFAREIREAEGLDCTLNDIIIERFYTDNEHREFHLLKDWNERGYRVKKGETAFVIWGKKRTAHQAKDGEPTTAEDESEGTEGNYKFFPLAYLFSNAQVISHP